MPDDHSLRLAAYAVCHDEADRVLLARWAGPDGPQWTLPGGGLDFGEHPQLGALRELAEETGYVGELESLLGVDAFFTEIDGVTWHSVRILYRAKIIGGVLTHEVDGSTDLAAWVPADELDGLHAVPLVDVARSLADQAGHPVARIEPTAVPSSELPQAARLAAYALIRDQDGRVLLVRAGRGTTWAGRWNLPGGWTAIGEDVAATVIREVQAETGFDVVVGSIIRLTSDVVESPPRKQQIWTVGAVCEARVVGGTLRSEVDGSSDDARWFTTQELVDAPLIPSLPDVLRAAALTV